MEEERVDCRYGKEGEFDEVMTHKPCVIEHNGIWYHFYTARARNWNRDSFMDGAITFATNVQKGLQTGNQKMEECKNGKDLY